MPYKYITLILTFVSTLTFSQTSRIETITSKLDEIALLTPGLNENVDFSVTGVSIQEFLRGLAESNGLNISVDPELNIKVYNNFTNEKVKNILTFLCKEYSLDIDFIGAIMSFHKYTPPAPPVIIKPAKSLRINYNLKDSTLSLDLNNDTLASVAKKITKLTGKNIVFPPSINKYQTLSLFLRSSKVEPAIANIAYALGYEMLSTENGTYTFSIATQEENTAQASTQTNRSKSKAENREIISKSGDFYFEVHPQDSSNTKTIDLEVNDIPIQQIIIEVSKEMGISFFLFSAPPGNTTSVLHGVCYEDFLSHLLQGTEHTFKLQDSIYIIGEESLEGLRSTSVYHFQYRPYSDIIDKIPSDLKKGVEIQEFEELNSIILSGSKPQINEIKSFISELDILVPLVMIEAIIVDVRKGNSLETELQLGFSPDEVSSKGELSSAGLNATFNSKSINNFLGPFNLGKVDKKFYASLKAMEESNDIKIRSTPKLSTLNGHEASLKIGQTKYYSVETQSTVGSLQPNTIKTQQYNSVNADLTVTIKPIVSGNEYVTLEIEVNNTDFTETVENQPPPTATSTFNSLVRMRNNEMIVLGGLERKEKTNLRKGFPILSRIPIIKWLFGSHKKSNKKETMMVFLKPIIIN